MRVAALVAAAALAAPAAVAEEDFRWQRTLEVPSPAFPTFSPDGPLYAHSKPQLADLRVLDATGRQVPWRRLPEPAPRRSKEVQLLNAGRRGRAFVGLLDLGPTRVVRNRAELVILSDRDFVGQVTVFGSDDRQSFTRLSTTKVFDLSGAVAARSTTLVFPPTDHRFLRLQGNVPIPDAVHVYNAPRRPRLETVPADASVEQLERATHVRLDLRYRRRPVDVLRIRASTARFDRLVVVSGSNGERVFRTLRRSRIVRRAGVSQLEIPVRATHRLLTLVVQNGDDAPLRGLRVTALARPRTIVLAAGFTPPYRLLYGNRSLGAPEYDFARLPPPAPRHPVAGRLGRERANPVWEPPGDTRSFLERNPRLVDGALALVALALATGGFLALRRRA